MTKKLIKPYVIETIIVIIIMIFTIGSYLITEAMKASLKEPTTDYVYVSYEILTDNVYPVIKEDKRVETILGKPYNEDDITIAKNYYDYKKDNQNDAIIYYENTYIQNTGIDFAKTNEFNVLSVLEGEVISVTNDDITGNTIKIKHNNNIISVYQSLGTVSVSEKDQVIKGQIIGTSGTNAINHEIGNHLHFELYINNVLVNPEDYFNKVVGE